MKTFAIILIFLIAGFFIWYVAIKENNTDVVILPPRADAPLEAVPVNFDASQINTVTTRRSPFIERFMSSINERSGWAKFN